MLEYQIDFGELLKQMPALDGQIDMVKQLRDRATKLNKEYNDKVDTDYKVYSQMRGFKEDEIDKSNVKIMTTRHYIRLLCLQESAKEFLNKMKEAELKKR